MTDEIVTQEAKCGVCGEPVWWDDTPNPICTGCELRAELNTLTPRTCGNCAHWNKDGGSVPGVGYCTNPVSWHRAKQMPAGESCTKWEKADDA